MRVVGTAGHVDHGKSSLVLALTGTDPDRWDEEKRRGLTIDLGFAHAALPSGEQISIVDVPGHVRFIRNMLAGAGAIDACLFVVAATEGWKPQSEEHLRILQLLGLRHGVVAMTKADLVDDEWRDLQVLEVMDHLAGTFLAEAPIVPVSSRTGAGLDDLRRELDALVARTPAAADRDRPRLWVDRSFAAKGSGTVVTGTLAGGRLAVDDRVTVLPSGVEVRIRAIQSHGASVAAIGPGHRVALNLTGVDHHEVHRGNAVVRAAQWRPSPRIDASLDVLASLEHVVSRRGAYTVHLGAGEWPARVRILGPDSIHPGHSGLVRLHLASPLPVVAGDRFVLRESGRDETVGGGEVLDVAPRLPASRARPDRSVDRIVAEHGWIDAAELEALTGARRTPDVGRWVVHPSTLITGLTALMQRVDAAGALGLDVASLDEHDRALVPRLEGVRADGGRLLPAAAVDPVADHPLIARQRAGGFAPPDVAVGSGPRDDVDKATLRELVRRGHLVEREGLLFHPEAIERAATAVARLLAAAPDGVTVSEAREALGITRKHAVPLLAELDARGITRRREDRRIAGPRLPAV
jgi:selenocysteine-specific elongation factor